jgi:hypothetical protein
MGTTHTAGFLPSVTTAVYVPRTNDAVSGWDIWGVTEDLCLFR